jgi:hypothetical protein
VLPRLSATPGRGRRRTDSSTAISSLVVLCLLPLGLPRALLAQYEMQAPSGIEIEFSSTQVRAMLDTTRTLEMNLQDDPRVLYFTLVGPPVETRDSLEAAYPWNAIEVRNDSVATILTPGNLREADRAYYSYAVIRMQLVRGLDPDVPCDELMERELEAVSAFVDGWVTSRLLFGGLPFAVLDELAFAREHGQLAGMLAAKSDRQLGACSAEWSADHAGAVEAYLSWRDTRFLELLEPAPDSSDTATRIEEPEGR